MRGRHHLPVLFCLLLVADQCLAELISLIAGGVLLSGGVMANYHHLATRNDGVTSWFTSVYYQASGFFVAYKDKIKCRVYECCDLPYVNPNFAVLDQQLKQFVFGQHLVRDTVVKALETHWHGKPKKPLVMSFHGYTGCGKNYVASIIAKNFYKNGMKSKFVHHIMGTVDFPDRSRIQEYQESLLRRLMSAASSCERSLFIFDEVDKMPEELLNLIKPMLDYHYSVRGVDFRRSVFLFLSNKGGDDIVKIAHAHHAAGKVREELRLMDFEGKVMADTYNQQGGLKMSEIISNHVIDHYVPFLPLERYHVEQCIEYYFTENGFAHFAKDKKKVAMVADQLKYFPTNSQIYSSSGCKRVAQKADLVMAKERRNLVIEHDEV